MAETLRPTLSLSETIIIRDGVFSNILSGTVFTYRLILVLLTRGCKAFFLFQLNIAII